MSLFRKRKTAQSGSSDCTDRDAANIANTETVRGENRKVKILGSGCAKCNALEAATKEALKMLDMDTTIDHVTDYSTIAAYGVMSTPALVVDGKVISYGKVLRTSEVIELLQQIK